MPLPAEPQQIAALFLFGCQFHGKDICSPHRRGAPILNKCTASCSFATGQSPWNSARLLYQCDQCLSSRWCITLSAQDIEVGWRRSRPISLEINVGLHKGPPLYLEQQSLQAPLHCTSQECVRLFSYSILILISDSVVCPHLNLCHNKCVWKPFMVGNVTCTIVLWKLEPEQ